MSDPVTYSADRVRRIRIALGVAIALGALSGIFALLVVVQVDRDGAGFFAAVLGVVSVVTIFWAFLTWRLLDAPDRSAKRSVIVTGTLLILFALPTLGLYGLGLLYVVLGMVLIFLAMVADEGPDT